jgi:hypothetical protein
MLLAVACVAVPAGVPADAADGAAVQSAVAYLSGELDPSLGLLREAPVAAPGRHWLLTDNQLAVWALEAAGEEELAARIEAAIAAHAPPGGLPQHGLIEVQRGDPIIWPPRTHITTELTSGVWIETRTEGSGMEDWAEYADLALYGAMDAANRGDYSTARRRYDDALVMFDGACFVDKAWTAAEGCTTYKLALALLAAERIGVRPDARMRPILLKTQVETGGFHTHYAASDEAGEVKVEHRGDTNVETTAYAILALTGGARGSR